jgi:N-acetylglucosamine kinase-like BadF-type ATPase
MFIGVDGGGTKTEMVVLDSEGVIRATLRTGGSSYLALGLDPLGTLLAQGIETLLGKAGLRPADVEFAFFGLPAFGEDSSLASSLSRLPARCLPTGSYLCGNDMICGWAGSLLCRDGISVVAGTGSICYGERGELSARAGGWGELFSDEGSAYWLACRALNLFSRMSDGREPRSALYDLLRGKLKITHDLDLCGHIYSQLAGDRAKIAQLGSLVSEAATLGDARASEILTDAARELALLVSATRSELRFGPSETVLVSYSGGVFDNAGASFVDSFTAALRAHGTEYRVCVPQLSPAIGAALYAAKRRGRPLSPTAIERLRA